MSALARIAVGAVTVLILVLAPLPVAAASTDYNIYVPAGSGCAFALGVDVVAAHKGNRKIHTFTDDDGNVVRVLETGKGSNLRFTNDATGKSMFVRMNGNVVRTTYNSDGTTTVANMGHSVISLFPTDKPAGPSTKLYVGRLVYTIDNAGNFDVKSFSGHTTDICKKLA